MVVSTVVGDGFDEGSGGILLVRPTGRTGVLPIGGTLRGVAEDADGLAHALLNVNLCDTKNVANGTGTHMTQTPLSR